MSVDANDPARALIDSYSAGPVHSRKPRSAANRRYFSIALSSSENASLVRSSLSGVTET